MTDEIEDPSDDSTGALRPIRALTRGLEALEALNARGQASVTDIARAIGLPRTTAYRVLETLCAGGYAERTADDRYRLLARVQRLSDGFAPEPWIERIVRPATATLARELSWPLLFATLLGTEMRATEIGSEPRVPERLPIDGAVGLAFLAACAEGQRGPLLTRLGLNAEEIMARLAEIRARGAALGDAGTSLLVAVPVVARGIGLGALALRAPQGALADQAIDRVIALLTGAAAEIGANWSA